MIALLLADAPDWVLTWRDTAVTIAAICGALVTITAAAHLPVVRVPVRWVARTLFAPAADAYWRRVRYEASQALSPELVGLAERLGAHGALLSQTRDELAEVVERVSRIEQDCTIIRSSASDIAAHTATDRRHDDDAPPGVHPTTGDTPL